MWIGSLKIQSMITPIWDPCYKWIGIITVSHNIVMQHFNHFNMLGLNIKGNMI